MISKRSRKSSAPPPSAASIRALCKLLRRTQGVIIRLRGQCYGEQTVQGKKIQAEDRQLAEQVDYQIQKMLDKYEPENRGFMAIIDMRKWTKPRNKSKKPRNGILFLTK